MATVLNADMKENMMDEKMHHNHKSGHDGMTMHDIKEAFKADFGDEISDSNKYCDMAHVAEHEGHEHLAEGLYAMAWDEYTHAKFIHENLIDWGCEIEEKEMMAWHELKERVARKFRKN